MPGHEPQAVAVVVELVRPAADLPLLGRVPEDRRVLPGGALHPVVLARQAAAQDHAVGAVGLAVGPDLVDARRPGVVGAGGPQGREQHRQRLPGALLHGLDRLVAPEARWRPRARASPTLGRRLRLGCCSRRFSFSSPRGPGRVLPVEELLSELLHARVARLDVARSDQPLEVDLADRAAGREDRELQQPQHLGAVAQAAVGGGVACRRSCTSRSRLPIRSV